MSAKRTNTPNKRTEKAAKAGRWAGALLGVAAMAGSAVAQPPGSGQSAGRDAKGRSGAGAYLIPSGQQAPGKVQQASLQPQTPPDDGKKLTPEEKAQLRLLLKSGQ